VAQRLKYPLVTCMGMHRDEPRVMVDQNAIGRLAADHLFVRGYRNFGFYGLENAAYSHDRQVAFARALAELGFTVHTHIYSPEPGNRQKTWNDEVDDLSKWISALPTPIGLFAANDQRARILADACSKAGKPVPNEVGIIGTDNEEIACEFGSPTLTSIACDWHAVGMETAALLDRRMDGAAPLTKDKLIPPIGIVARESTSAVVTSDPLVATAIAFANRHAGEAFGVEALVAAAGVSRRRLENAFQKSLGCSPMTFLARQRIERAKSLLQRKKLSLTRIAEQCGFTDLRHFRRTFRRLTQMTPRQYQTSMTLTLQR
jgi:LacI family transcriptional regulator